MGGIRQRVHQRGALDPHSADGACARRHAALIREDTLIDPIARLRDDRALARTRQDPCAGLCSVANVDETGAPQLRTLVLRELDDGLALFVNATSPKWPLLCDAPVGVLVWLPTLNVQYRLSCTTSEVPQAIVHASWHLRPVPPKRLDWFYTHVRPQGSTVESREHLLAELAGLALPEPLTAPHTARGLYLHPDVVERLDLAQHDGIHDRRLFRRRGGGWVESVLTP